jgi:hypothetical protein
METETRLLADVYGLLLTDIRRNRARRLATQAQIRAPAEEENIDRSADFAFTMSGTEPTNGSSIEQNAADRADNEATQSR